MHRDICTERICTKYEEPLLENIKNSLFELIFVKMFLFGYVREFDLQKLCKNDFKLTAVFLLW